MFSSRAAWRFTIFLGLIGLTAGVALIRAGGDLPMTPEAVRDAIREWGPLAPIAFTGAFVVRPFIFFPSTLLFVAGGLAFGVVWGTIYAAAGATIGAAIGFGIARVLGREFVLSELGDRPPPVAGARWGMGLVFVLNLIPIVPITAINYGAGLSGMGLLPFLVEVVAGLTPRAFAYSFFGNSLLEIRSNEFAMAVGLLALLVVVPLLVRRHLQSRAAVVRSRSAPDHHM